MEGIEIGKAISDYGIAIITGIFLVLVCWIIRYLVEEQSKNNKEVLSMFKVELKSLHRDGLRNAVLNRKSISMLGTLSEYFNKYLNGNSEKIDFKRKVNKENGRK